MISCNDVHRFVPEIGPQPGIPFLHIAEATADAIDRRGLRRVALLGVRKTMEGDFYPEIFRRRRIETAIPDSAQRAFVHDRIYAEHAQGVFTADTRLGYQKIIDDLASRGAEGVVLACTEIPLLLQPDQISIPSFSTTEIHCAAAVDHAIAKV